MDYFARQPEGPGRDRCLILVSSFAGDVDKPGSPQYNTAKFGVRGLMRCLRTTMPERRLRASLLAPWYVPGQARNGSKDLCGSLTPLFVFNDTSGLTILRTGDRGESKGLGRRRFRRPTAE